MNTTTSVVLTTIVVGAGQWAQKDKGPSVKLVVGGMVLTVFLAAMSEGNAKLAQQFSLLVLVAALLTYAIPIARKLGYSK